MERIFAAVDGGTISNTFVGDDNFADLVRPDHDDVVEVTSITPQPGLGWTVHSDGYRPPSPFASWAWDGTEWKAPVPRPTEGGPWQWDEDSQSWIEITIPSPE